ncbi:hypothetical protein KEM09_06525 [Carboxylicivirga mesophila]|uniref:Lipoprotein n=1 Tax=Carboxylicivirga mesophila TaxID=1166478 RepID=A0ABS5K813_9BACT|nr:hypothetical protein [Carboxylicivirga mesophila]MBS2211047.1 hypothetical protein [Carboxylicivirga mesophila]
MKAKLFGCFLLILFACACDMVKDCPACMTPPKAFVFNMVDNGSGENLFTNGTFSIDDIQIKDVITQKSIEFDFIDENNLGYINLYSVGWQTEVVNCYVYHDDDVLFTFYVDAVRKSEDCCSFTDYNAIELEGAEFELDGSSGVYDILL